MKEKGQYYVLKEKAVPEVLLKVVEAKRLIESGKSETTPSFDLSYKSKDPSQMLPQEVHSLLPQKNHFFLTP